MLMCVLVVHSATLATGFIFFSFMIGGAETNASEKVKWKNLNQTKFVLSKPN